MKPTLLVLAAGIGSRYGGLKQIEPVGPHGELILEYSVHDALKAGFGKIVFVIRHEIEEDFRTHVGSRLTGKLPIGYAFQSLDSLPDGITPPPGRTKPWGTGHAILVAQEKIKEPFAAINADDFYGQHAFRLAAEGLAATNSQRYCMVGFMLGNTLSEHGHVSRGVCQCDEAGDLRTVVEHTKVFRDGRGARSVGETEVETRLTGDETVSMNLWGFDPSIFEHLKRQFEEFLQERGQETKSEFYIPSVVDRLIREGKTKVIVKQSPDSWFGVTYPEDKPTVIQGIRALVARGDYPGEIVELEFDPAAICAAFSKGRLRRWGPLGSGHINNTYLVVLDEHERVLQRINRSVFPDPEGLMTNTQRVCQHLLAKGEKSLELLPTRDGRTFHRDQDGNYWRLSPLITGTKTVDQAETVAQAYQAGRGFGRFLCQLSDLGGARLVETIPDFHNTPKRFEAFRKAVNQDIHGRLQGARREVEELLGLKPWATRLTSAELPERITHNDTKINNVLLDVHTEKTVCVIDLDTVMPGLVANDFGDLVRTTATFAAEDEPDLSKIHIDMTLFEGLAQGFLSEAGPILTDEEWDTLSAAGPTITFELALRFLTDHLEGDCYFKTHQADHNLIRARAQMALMHSMESQAPAMEEIIRGVRQPVKLPYKNLPTPLTPSDSRVSLY